MDVSERFPDDILATAVAVVDRGYNEGLVDAVCRALLAERERWRPAVNYFERYCQDEADDVENCVCGMKQHEDARAFAAVVRS